MKLGEQHKDFFELELEGLTYNFHYIWLRHNCNCIDTEKGCRHSLTKERIINLSKIPRDIHPKELKINKEELETVWSDGHNSTYSKEFLLKHKYSLKVQETKPEDITVEYKDRNPKLFYDILSKYGMLVVKNGPKELEGTLKIAQEQFKSKIIETHFGLIEDLMPNNTTNKNNDQLGYTHSAVELHTDQPFIQNPPVRL